MRLLKYLLATLLAFASPVEAAGWLPLSNPTFTQTDNGCLTVSGTTTTFTAKGLGTASPSRIIAVTINWSDSTLAGTAQITAVTVAGSSTLRAVRALSNGQNSNSEVWWLQLPSGTSGDIIVTSSTAINAMTIAIYSLVGFNSIAPYATTTGTTTISQAFQAKNVALEAGSRTVNVSTSLSALTNDFSSACGTGLWGVHASGALNGNGTLTSNINPTSNNPEMALAIWSVQAPVIVNCATSSLTNVIGAWDSNVFASLTLSGSTVTGIADQSGTGNNLTAAGGGAVT